MTESAGDVLDLTSDVIGGGAALAGLILVYLGSVMTGFSGYDPAAQDTVRGRYQFKAWLAAIGILFGLAASGLALVAKWQALSWMAGWGVWCFIVALGWAALTAILSALEIR